MAQANREDPLARHGRDLTTGSIPRQLITFALPLLAGAAIQTAYGIVNRIWVGQYLGPPAVAAITITFQVSFILIAVANGLTMGSSILVSQFVGARNWAGVRRVVQSSLFLAALLSLVLLAAGQLLTEPLLRAINTPPEAWPLAVGYMRLFLCSFPLMFAAFLTIQLMRGIGDSLTPLYFQALGLVINAILDPLLMLGWLGFPRLGLNGTAVAMLISQSIAMTAFFVFLHRRRHALAPDWRRLNLDWPMSKVTLKIGIPAAAQQLLVSTGTAVILYFINAYGEAATAGFGAASSIDGIAFFLAMSFGMSVSVLAGQNIGARRFDRVRETFWWGLALCGGAVCLIAAAAISAPTLLMHLFLNPARNAEAFAIGVAYLRIVGVSYIFLAVMFVAIGVVNGAGHTLVNTFTTIIGLWLVRIPLAAGLSHHLHSVNGIWYAMVVSFAVSMALSVGYFFSGYWKRPVVRHGPALAGLQPAADDEPLTEPHLEPEAS